MWSLEETKDHLETLLLLQRKGVIYSRLFLYAIWLILSILLERFYIRFLKFVHLILLPRFVLLFIRNRCDVITSPTNYLRRNFNILPVFVPKMRVVILPPFENA